VVRIIRQNRQVSIKTIDTVNENHTSPTENLHSKHTGNKVIKNSQTNWNVSRYSENIEIYGKYDAIRKCP